MDNGLSSALCTECHEFLLKWIVFADHAQKVQKLFKVLKSSDSNVKANSLRQRLAIWETNTQKQDEDCQEFPLEGDDVFGHQEFVAVAEDELQTATVEQSDDYIKEEAQPTENLSKTDLDNVSKIASPSQPPRKRWSSRRAKLKRRNSKSNESACSSTDADPLESVESSASSKSAAVECQNCHRVYKHSDSLSKHLKMGCKGPTLQRKPRARSTCKLCNKSFTQLLTHMRYVHEDFKPYVCDICGGGHKSMQDLNKHKFVHTNEKPCVCKICKASFKSENQLKAHMESHSGASYECDICGKKMKTRATFSKHKRVHTATRRFKCDVCGAGFNYRALLKGHLLSHTGLKPYTCKFCKKCFASKTNWRAHQQRKHTKEIAEEGGRCPSPSGQNEPTMEELRVMAISIAKEAEAEYG